MTMKGERRMVEARKDHKAEDRKEMNEIIRKDRETFLTILENYPHGVALVLKDGTYRYINQKFTDITGYTMDEVQTGRQWFKNAFPDPEYRRGVISTWSADTKRAGPGEREVRVFTVSCADGSQKKISIVTVVLQTGDFIVSYEDVTEQRRKEENLLLTQFSIDHASESIFWIKPGGGFSYVNEAACRMLGFTSHDLLRMSVYDIVPDFVKEDGSRLWDSIKNRGALTFESQFRARDGRLLPVEVTGNYVQFRGREYVLVFSRDITWRKRAKEALDEERERLSVTLGSIGDGVIATDTEGRIVLINAVAAHLTGWTHDEATGRQVEEVFRIINEKTRKECENPITKVLRTGRTVALGNHTLLISREGLELVIADSGAPIRKADGSVIGVVLVFRDVTMKLKAEEELSRISRLESIGVLAGGIAHDFNNILSMVLGNVSLARLYATKDTEKAVAKCRDAEQAIVRAKDLTQQLLTFSKGGTPVKKTASIVEVLKESARFALTGTSTLCEFDFPDDLSPVEMDEGQIGQVISNLAINAHQAMPNGGAVRIKAENAVLREDAARHGYPLRPGRYVKISVSDQGEGIPRERLGKIFDPYFTTKKKGSGLGLAIAYSIIKNHDGFITAESVAGKGSVFTIYLPASAHPAPSPGNVKEQTTSGRGRILIMDDEEMIRSITGEMLDSLGYEAGFAVNGEEALALFNKARGEGRPFDGMLLDLTIPGGMGGVEVMARMRETDPDVPAVVLSGYSNSPVMLTFGEHGFKGVLSKPYTLQELSETISKIIGGK